MLQAYQTIFSNLRWTVNDVGEAWIGTEGPVTFILTIGAQSTTGRLSVASDRTMYVRVVGSVVNV